MWTPPPPEFAADDLRREQGHYMTDSRARSALGPRYALWRRLGQLVANHDDLNWGTMWAAAKQLSDEGQQLRDRHIMERARQLDAVQAAYLRDLEEQRQRRERRRHARSNAETEGRDAE